MSSLVSRLLAKGVTLAVSLSGNSSHDPDTFLAIKNVANTYPRILCVLSVHITYVLRRQLRWYGKYS